MKKLWLPIRFISALSGAGKIGLAITLIWFFVAIFGTLIAPYNANLIGQGPIFGHFSEKFWMGTDYLGRDIFSRVLYGARYSIGLALTAAVLSSIVGALLAMFSALIGGWFEEVIGRLNDALLVLPGKVLSLMIVAVFGSSLPMLVFTTVLTYFPGAYRIAYAMAGSLRNMDYVKASKLRGEGRWYIAVHDILPNLIHPMLADFGLRFVYIVLLLSGLSFLGLGVQPPAADWGTLVKENMQGIFSGSPAVLMPAVAISSLTIGVTLFIDSLRNINTAKLREERV